ncbi:MAG: hypothetical protein DRH26_17245, partial [Deltaproteobacteria bacterium]
MNKKIIFIIAIMFFYRPVFAGNNSKSILPVVKSIKIQILAGEPARREKLEKMAYKMIRFKQDERFSHESLLDSIELLKQTHQFSRIDVPDQDWEAAFTDVVFRLTPSTLIRDIRVKGSFPIFKNDVIDVTDYKVGDAFNQNSLEKNIHSIEALFKENGYTDTAVKILVEKTGDLEVVILILVEKKEFLRISKIEFNGNKSFSDTRLKMRMKSYELPIFFWSKGQRFIQDEFEKDMKMLLAFYREKGFAEVVIKHRLEKNDQAETIGIIINIEEGPRNEKDLKKEILTRKKAFFNVNQGYQKTITNVSFQGLSDQFEKDLRQIIEIRPGKAFVKALVQKDRMTILSYLAEKGYIYAKVEAQVKPAAEKETCSIEFHIDKKTEVSAGGVWTFGNFRTKDSVLLRHNTINDNEPVSLNKFAELQKSIRNINCIERSEFKVLGIEKNSDQIFFIADVEEKKSYFLEASLGYDTARDAYLGVSLGDRNFFGMNRELSMDVQISGTGYETMMGIKDFDFLSQYITARFSVYASREELKN